MTNASEMGHGNMGTAGKLLVSGSSHVGLIRQRNEDAISIAGWQSPPNANSSYSDSFLPNQPLLLAVADGLGGHPAGHVASKYVLRELNGIELGVGFEQRVGQVIPKIESGLQKKMRESPELIGMGSTLAGVIFSGSQLFHINVGDSRIYLHSGGRLHLLSVDHKDEFSGRLTRALGGRVAKSEPPAPSTGHTQLSVGDTVLICSDGLTDMIDDMELLEWLSARASKTANDLVTATLERGASDNVSVIIARIED